MSTNRTNILSTVSAKVLVDVSWCQLMSQSTSFLSQERSVLLDSRSMCLCSMLSRRSWNHRVGHHSLDKNGLFDRLFTFCSLCVHFVVSNLSKLSDCQSVLSNVKDMWLPNVLKWSYFKKKIWWYLMSSHGAVLHNVHLHGAGWKGECCCAIAGNVGEGHLNWNFNSEKCTNSNINSRTLHVTKQLKCQNNNKTSF